MKKKMIIFALIAATGCFWLPSAGTQVLANTTASIGTAVIGEGLSQPGKRGKWRKKNAHGYRNYGQYRRTQVGHRRYRLVKRYYWNDGVRLSRRVRIYY
jgi:hypothetical protein